MVRKREQNEKLMNVQDVIKLFVLMLEKETLYMTIQPSESISLKLKTRCLIAFDVKHRLK